MSFQEKSIIYNDELYKYIDSTKKGLKDKLFFYLVLL